MSGRQSRLSSRKPVEGKGNLLSKGSDAIEIIQETPSSTSVSPVDVEQSRIFLNARWLAELWGKTLRLFRI